MARSARVLLFAIVLLTVSCQSVHVNTTSSGNLGDPPPSHPNTIMAASCSASDVQSALNSINTDGAVVTIPAGTCTYSGSSTPVSYTQTNSFTIEGAGAEYCLSGDTCTSPSGADQTIIQDNVTHDGTNPPTFVINTIAGKSFRMTGMAFVTASSNSTRAAGGIVVVKGDSPSVRIDHNHFNLNSLALTVGGNELGVVDHNWVDHVDNAIFVNHNTWNGQLKGNGSWADDPHFGTNLFVFLEDNGFNNLRTAVSTYANDCNYGGRIVGRHNMMLNGSAWQQHEESSVFQSCRAVEFYLNNAVNTAQTASLYGYWRGGTGLVWGNTVSGYTSLNTAHIDRANVNNGFHAPVPNNWGQCGGTVPHCGTLTATSGSTASWTSGDKFDTNWLLYTVIGITSSKQACGATGTWTPLQIQSVSSSTSLTMTQSALSPGTTYSYSVGSPWDGNEDETGYPCFNQMGRGKGDLLTGGFGSMYNTQATTGVIGAIGNLNGGESCVRGDAVNVIQNGASGGMISFDGSVWSILAAGSNYSSSNGSNSFTTSNCAAGAGPTGSIVGVIRFPHEALEPWYVWGQNYTPGIGKYWGSGDVTSLVASLVQENRDYYLECPNTDGTCQQSDWGSKGIGQGPLAQRPANCTPLVGYWATDTNTLYQCQKINTWVPYYTPYTYPHPLTVSQ